MRRRRSVDRQLDTQGTTKKKDLTRHILALFLILMTCGGCQHLPIRDAESLLFSSLQKSEVWGFVAGAGTTFAAVPDLTMMFKRRSNAGMNPRMAGILAVFQMIWIYYGLLIESRPVIAWNAIAVFINSISVCAFVYFGRRDKAPLAQVLRRAFRNG